MTILRNLASLLVAVCKLGMVLAFVIMMGLTLFQVINRYAIGLPIFWTEELIVFLLVWSAMLGLPVQLWEHQDIVVDFLNLPNAMLDRVKQVAGTLSSVAFCAVLAWSGWEFATRGWAVISPTLGLPRFWFFLPISLSAAISVLVLVLRERGPSAGGFD
ncbi:TRAP transporter small permease subunit [Devosia sp. BK]|uniref:TRAP transporter small permease n=1 Tax=Devosia sp. BK TaxID=2871706 RepID=UPI00293A2C01|nr:TRAP transporter small permease subunit [Devosia sp. BK]MDV3253769.1 TRAP transporter small permease subunit [Devosia sp. BK]